jgi:transcriptional regulator with XRE-family HTH domain
MKTFGSRLRAARTARGFTQEHVALEIGVSNGTVSQWERDGSEPNFSNLTALRDLLGVTLDELISGDAVRSGDSITPTGKELVLLQRLRKMPAKKRAAVLALFDL